MRKNSGFYTHWRITEEKGLTIIELLVVVVIVSILAGFTVIQYNNFRIHSNNSVAEADLRNLVTYEVSFFTSFGIYVPFNVEDISKDGMVEKTVTLQDGNNETFIFKGFSKGVNGCVKVKNGKFANAAVKHNMGTKYVGYDFENGIFFHKHGSMGVKLKNSDVPDVVEKSTSEWSGWEVGLGR